MPKQLDYLTTRGHMPSVIRLADAALERGLDEDEAAKEVVRVGRVSRTSADYAVRESQAAYLAQKATKGLVTKVRRAAAASTIEDEAITMAEGRSRSLDRLVVQGRAREVSFLRELEEVARRSFSNKIVVKTPDWGRRKTPTDRVVNLILSDLHFGSDLDPRECPQAFGPAEEARRLAWVVQQTAEYKPQYRDRTTLRVHILGDVLQNQLHDARDGKPLAQQACAAISYLTQALAYLSTCYKSVEADVLTGNHDRFTSRHHGRAIHQKWDSLGTVVYFGVSAGLAHLTNVRVNIHKTAYYTWESFGSHGFATHGDTVFNPGQPSKTINVAALEGQVHELNDGFRQEGRAVCRVFLHGHTHHAYRNCLNTGEVIVGNGQLVPPDSYAVSLGKLGTSCSQTIFESVPGYLAGDYRTLEVGRKQDQDASLECIVRPFWGLDGC